MPGETMMPRAIWGGADVQASFDVSVRSKSVLNLLVESARKWRRTSLATQVMPLPFTCYGVHILEARGTIINTAIWIV